MGFGIRISRRPKSRESRENAPGPSKAITAAKTIRPMRDPVGNGRLEVARAIAPMPITTAIIGVKKPISKKAALRNTSAVASPLSRLSSREST